MRPPAPAPCPNPQQALRERLQHGAEAHRQRLDAGYRDAVIAAIEQVRADPPTYPELLPGAYALLVQKQGRAGCYEITYRGESWAEALEQALGWVASVFLDPERFADFTDREPEPDPAEYLEELLESLHPVQIVAEDAEIALGFGRRAC